MTNYANVKYELVPQAKQLDLETGQRVVAGGAVFLEIKQAVNTHGSDLLNLIVSTIGNANFDSAVVQDAYFGNTSLRNANEMLAIAAESLFTILLSDIDTNQQYSDYDNLSDSGNAFFRVLRPYHVYTREGDGSLTADATPVLGDTLTRDDTAQSGTFGGVEWAWETPGLAATFLDQKLFIHPTTSGAIADDSAAATFAANQALGDPNTGGSVYTGPPVVGAWYVRADGTPRVWNGSVWSNVLKFSLLEGTVPGVAALIGESDTIVGLVKDGEIHLGVKNQTVDAGWLEGKTLAEIEQAFNLQIDAKIEAGKLRRTHRGKVYGKHDFSTGAPADGRHISATDVEAAATVRFSTANYAYIFQDSRFVGAYVENDPIVYGELATWDPTTAIPSGATEMIKPSASADLAVALEIGDGLIITFVDGLITELREANDPLELDGLSDWTVGESFPPDGTYSTHITLGATVVVELQSTYKKDWIYTVLGGVATEEPEGVEPADRVIVTGGAEDEDMGFIYGITTTEQSDHGAVGEYNWNPAREQFSSQEHLFVAELTSSGGLVAYVANAISDFLTETAINNRIDAATATFVDSEQINQRINTAIQDFVTSDAIDARLANEIKAAFDSRFHYGSFHPREVPSGVGLDAMLGQPYAVAKSPAHFFYSVPNTGITLQFLTHDNGLIWRDMR